MTFASGPLPQPHVSTKDSKAMIQPVSAGRIVLVGKFPAIVVAVKDGTDTVDAFLFDPENTGFIEGVEYFEHSLNGWHWPPRIGGASP